MLNLFKQKGYNMRTEIFLYVVVFHQENYDMSYNPIIYKIRGRSEDGDKNSMHLLDPDMVPTLSILEYILQLPSFNLDLLKLDIEIVNREFYKPHHIVLIPDSIIKEHYNFYKPMLEQATAIFETDNANLPEINHNPPLGIHKCSDIGQELLNKQWKKAEELIKNYCEDDSIIEYYPVYLQDNYLKILPMLFFARQGGKIGHILAKAFHTPPTEIEKLCGRTLYYLKHNYAAIEKLLSICEEKYPGVGTDSDEVNKYLKENIEKTCQSMIGQFNINVVVTYPGLSKRQRKISGITQHIPIEEKRAIRIMGLHNAVATNSAFIEFPAVNDKMYQLWDGIEQEFINKLGTNNPHIWQTLRNIGSELSKQLSDEQIDLLLQAPSITAFTDFPLGLAILPGQNVPLSVSRSISYQPLTPLSRNICVELSQPGQLSLFDHCRILFIECIPDDDKNHEIRRVSEVLYESIKGSADNYRKKGCIGIEVYREEAYTIKEMKSILNKYEPGKLEILIISAHGFCDEEKNCAGLCIGNEKWMANDNYLHFPPIVLLSACHVSPRGRNVVNAADIMFRAGAMVVISTMLPVNAPRNTMIYSRLFTYIFEGINGSVQYKTLADAWTGVVATNAINEIIECSHALKEWYFRETPGKETKLFEFTMEKSVNRLRTDNIYQDTIDVLKEMLKEDGMERKYDPILKPENIFPESFFYQMLGKPETILLSKKALEK